MLNIASCAFNIIYVDDVRPTFDKRAFIYDSEMMMANFQELLELFSHIQSV